MDILFSLGSSKSYRIVVWFLDLLSDVMENLRNVTVSSVRFKGQIQLIIGPMFSGKTTELLRRINRYKIAKCNVLLLKYARDVRYKENSVSTHDKHAVPAKSAVLLNEVLGACHECDVIGIDEGQFFADIIEFAELLANYGKIVIVAGLDGTYEREPFSNIQQLVPKAESVVKLSAVCSVCHEDAAFTRRLSSETAVDAGESIFNSICPISEFQVELIGGVDKYMAVCRRCYRKELPME